MRRCGVAVPAVLALAAAARASSAAVPCGVTVSAASGAAPLSVTFTAACALFAVHGYPDVPPYPASHGCARIPMWIAQTVFTDIPDSSAVYVYA